MKKEYLKSLSQSQLRRLYKNLSSFKAKATEAAGCAVRARVVFKGRSLKGFRATVKGVPVQLDTRFFESAGTYYFSNPHRPITW